MSYGTLSNLGKAQTLIHQTDLTAMRLSSLAALYGYPGLSEATLSRALKGGKPLGTDADKDLGILVRKIEALILRLQPLAISFASPSHVKKLIDDVEAGRTVIIVVDGIAPSGEQS